MGAISWAGTVAGALIAVATVLRWTVRRIARSARWITAVVALPATLDRLSASVDALARILDRPYPQEPPCSPDCPSLSAGT